MEASEQIKRFGEFFDLSYGAAIVENLRKGNKFLVVDFAELIKFDPELAEQLLEEPDEVIRAAELAIEDSGREGDLKKFKVRFRNLPKTQHIMIRNIRSNHIGKLFWTEGVVRQKSDVRPQAIVAKFECPACGNTISVPQLDKKFHEPSRCGCGKKGRFRLLSKELVDVQGIVLEESPEDLEGGDQPKRMQIFLQCDLVSPLSEKRTSPGSKIRIGGIIKEVPITLQTGGQSTRFDLLIEANCVEGVEENFSDITISSEELKAIKELAEDPKIYDRLISSIAPSIYGHERIKEALILQLMGGLKKERKDGVSIRGDIHILLIGDPGSGKSQLLKRVSKISPKGRYVSGKGVSGAGLTATVVKDEFLRGWSLEAGALVLANKGLCVAGDTSILLANGSVMPMQQVYEERLKGKDICVQSLDTKTFKICEQKVLGVSQRIAEKLLEIKFDTGDKLHITPEHPLPAWDNGLRWVPCGKLKAGASVVLPTEFISKKDVENAALLELCGMIATDGHLTKKKYGISFYSAEKWMIERAKYLVNACFGKEMHVHKNNRGSLHAHIGSKEIHEKIKNFGIPVGKKNGLIDCALLNLSYDDVRAFIIGAINGDGSISNRKGGGIVSLITQNSQTAETYRKLLRKIGVIGRIRKIFSKGGGVVKKGEYLIFHVCITGRENIAKLRDSRLEPTKLAALNKILERRSMDGRIPHVDELIESVRAELKHGQKQALYMNGIKQSQLDDGYGVKRRTLQRALEALAALLILPTNSLQALKNAAQDNVHIGKIISLKEIPPAEVFNLQTDAKEDPNYIANFIPVHNCMIDELDKMSTEDRSAMHEALEQQSVSISKANIQATLRAETTVLAAANPKFGRFDPYGEAISKQINLPTTLINRFDLIFAIKDQPQHDKDEKMAKFILGMHQNPDVENVELDTKLLRKYIAYARQNVHPKLSDGASEEIQSYYLKMRASGTVEGEMKAIPISARQLEALVRLSEASAKVRLSNTVTRKDAKRAIDILHYCLSEIALDKETGQIDIDRISTGIPSSERSKITIIKELIDKLSEKSKQIAVQDLIDMAKERNINEGDVDEVIERLKRSGDIFEPKPALIQKI